MAKNKNEIRVYVLLALVEGDAPTFLALSATQRGSILLVVEGIRKLFLIEQNVFKIISSSRFGVKQVEIGGSGRRVIARTC